MIVETYRLPGSNHITSYLDAAIHLNNLPLADQYEFDFGVVQWMEPFQMLLWSHAIAQFKSRRPGKNCFVKNHLHLTYPAHMGFFKAFGHEYGKFPGEAPGGSTYLPLEILDCERMRADASTNYQRIGEFVEKKAKELACILAQIDKGILFETLVYSLTEIIRNVLEHSESTRVALCAQYWANRGKVEMAILDTGIGVKKSLSQNPQLGTLSDIDALKFAIGPGISSKAHIGSKRNKEDIWENSGYGLYMTHRLCKESGSFFILSGEAALEVRPDAFRPISAMFPGTVIRMVLNVNWLKTRSNLNELLRTFMEEGETLAKRFGNEERVTASTFARLSNEEFT